MKNDLLHTKLTLQNNFSGRGARATGAAAPATPAPPPPPNGAIELFYHPNKFASDVRNEINELELIVVGRHWSF